METGIKVGKGDLVKIFITLLVSETLNKLYRVIGPFIIYILPLLASKNHTKVFCNYLLIENSVSQVLSRSEANTKR